MSMDMSIDWDRELREAFEARRQRPCSVCGTPVHRDRSQCDSPVCKAAARKLVWIERYGEITEGGRIVSWTGRGKFAACRWCGNHVGRHDRQFCGPECRAKGRTGSRWARTGA